MKLISYVPHGAVPDIRGFSPALVAANLVKHLKFFSPITVCGNEQFPAGLIADANIGFIFRLKQGRMYRQILKKIMGLDPYPLEARAAKFAHRFGADIIHAHQLEFPIENFLRKLRRRIPVIVHAHAVRAFDQARGIAEKYIAVSQYTKENLIRLGYPEGKIEVVYNGVDTSLFYPSAIEEKEKLRAVLEIPAESTVLGFVGRKSASKGYLIFLRVARRLLADFPNLFIIAAGPIEQNVKHKPDFLNIESEAAQLRATKRFINFPALPHHRLANVYRTIDVFLSPTYFNGEQHPLAVCEALASGCITVASDFAGIREAITNNDNGILLADPHNEIDVLNRVGQIISNIEGFQYLRDSARNCAIANFDWSIAAGKLEKIYLGILNDQNAA